MEKKRGAAEDPRELRDRTEAESAGRAMDQSSGGLAEAIPEGATQEPNEDPMAVDSQQEGRPLHPKEAAAWK
eukprot:4460299-Heterocapsa_arctica.AAC.1